jgi:hypothetical protein
MAVDTVQSEPLSGEFPLTGNLTEKFRPLHRNRRQVNLVSRWIYDSYHDLDQAGALRKQGIIDRTSDNIHSLMPTL